MEIANKSSKLRRDQEEVDKKPRYPESYFELRNLSIFSCGVQLILQRPSGKISWTDSKIHG